MRNLLLICLVAIFAVSCSKEAITTNSSGTKQESSKLNLDDAQLKSGTWRTYFDNGGAYFFCAVPAGNCYPIDIVVTGIHEPVFQDIMSALATNNATKVSEEFSDHRDVLKEYFDVVEIDEVIDSNMTVVSRGTIAGNKVCFIFKDSTNAIKTVYPLTY